MKELLDYILKSIADHPESINITEDDSQPDLLQLKFTVHPEDMGRIIGKEGKTIGALRNILKIAAIKKGMRVNLSLEEPLEKESSPDQ